MSLRAAATAFLVGAVSGCAPATAATHVRYYIGSVAIAAGAAIAYAALRRWTR